MSTAGISSTILPKLCRSARSAWQIARGVVGETAYERYLEHHNAHHPDEPAMGEREFWRRHIDRGDTQPGSRCC
ncbi:YbdD/YjiX family protein [Parasphingorhabdus pacifica]